MSNNDRLWILFASDPEMQAIEKLLREVGETNIAYAVAGVDRVNPSNAYKAERAHYARAFDDENRTHEDMGHNAYPQTGVTEYWIEGDFPLGRPRALNDAAEYIEVYRIDHHRPGDYGYGLASKYFLEASSLGQVIKKLALLGLLNHWQDSGTQGHIPGYFFNYGSTICIASSGPELIVPHELVLIAAADHCLGAAYRGECPGVNPDELLKHRVAQTVAFKNDPAITAESVLLDIATAHQALLDAPEIILDGHMCPWHGVGHSTAQDCANESGTDYADDPCWEIYARDMRGHYVPGLPDAGTRWNISYIADGLPGRDGRVKVVCSGNSDAIKAFMNVWAKQQGLVDIYGDPARGFAGGYKTKE